MADPPLRTVVLTLCQACLDGKGDECHTPGCALLYKRPPDLPVTAVRDLRDEATVSRVSDALCEEDDGRCFYEVYSEDEWCLDYDGVARFMLRALGGDGG